MKCLQKPQVINVVMNDEKMKKLKPALLSGCISLSLSMFDNSWTLKTMIAAIAPGLCTSILLGLPFLIHNHIIVDHEILSAIVKDTCVDLLNFALAPKSVPKVIKSPKCKHLEVKFFHQELLKELKWKCGVINARLGRTSQVNCEHGENFIAVNFIGVVKDKLESLELQQKYNMLEDGLETEFGKIFEPISDVKELLDNIYCRIKLKDTMRTISNRTYGCPCKYHEAWKTLIDMHIDSGKIRLSNLSFTSPSFIIPKTDPMALPCWVNDY